MKKLLAADYEEIVKKALCLREADLRSYYFGIAEEYASSHPNLFDSLERAIECWKNWLVGQIMRLRPVPPSLKEIDETGLPRIHNFGIGGHLYKADIEKQLTYISSVKEVYTLVQKIREYERQLPFKARERLRNFPEPNGLQDFSGWKDRLNLIQQISESSFSEKKHKYESELKKIQQEREVLEVEKRRLQTATSKESQQEAETFKDLFYNQGKIVPYSNVLNQLDKGTIVNDRNEYLGGSQKKSIISVWFNELVAHGLVSNPGAKRVAELANAYFIGLNASEKVFRSNVNTHIATDVRATIQAQLSNI